MTADSASREEAFQRHLAGTENYFATVRSNGDKPWFEDVERLARLESSFPGISEHAGEDARRIFFLGRYTRPEPPEGLTNNLTQIRNTEEHAE